MKKERRPSLAKYKSDGRSYEVNTQSSKYILV